MMLRLSLRNKLMILQQNKLIIVLVIMGVSCFIAYLKGE